MNGFSSWKRETNAWRLGESRIEIEERFTFTVPNQHALLCSFRSVNPSVLFSFHFILRVIKILSVVIIIYDRYYLKLLIISSIVYFIKIQNDTLIIICHIKKSSK